MTSAWHYVLCWDQAIEKGTAQAGGKGWNLGRLVRYGFKVPPGYVLGTDAYAGFIEYNDLNGVIDGVSQAVTLDNLDQGSKQLSQLQERIREAALPPRVAEEIATAHRYLGIVDTALAVRSSASAEDSAFLSFAGVHETSLNVVGLDQVFEAIKHCYASLWTAQAVAYRRRFELSDREVAPAVVIMAMVDARASGVAFTCDPRTGRLDRLVVHANFGLGESVVSGAIEPDSYSLDAAAWYAIPPIVNKTIGRKEGATWPSPDGGTVFIPRQDSSSRQVLSDDQIQDLGVLILRVFEALGEGEQQLDIEWAFDGREFMVLQSRPVTARTRHTLDGLKGQPEIWSNGNYRDAVPMVLSPLHRRVMKNIIDLVQYASLSAVDYPIPEGFQFSRLIKGRLYCNISALQWAYYDCGGTQPRAFNPFWGGHQPTIEVPEGDPFQGEKGQLRLERAMKGSVLVKESVAEAPHVFAEVSKQIESLLSESLSVLSDRDFIDKYHKLGRVIHDYTHQFNWLAGAGNLPMVVLMENLAKHLGDRAMVVVNGLMVGGETAITSADHGYRLVRLAQMAREDQAAQDYLQKDDYCPRQWEYRLPEDSPFKTAFRSFVQEFGHRGVYELDIINPRWHEDPTYLLEVIRSTMDQADLEQWKSRQEQKFDLAWQEVLDKVPAGQLEEIRMGIKEAQRGAAVREMTKSVLVRALQVYRQMALELGRRFKQRGILLEVDDIFFGSWPDVFALLKGQWSGDGWQSLIADRRLFHKEKERVSAPDLIVEEKPLFCQAVLPPSGHYLTGVGVSTGEASGPACLINHPAEGQQLQPGGIMVAPSTDPGWTPLFLKASALVMETGGFLSHGSIVAREYGVPAVVNVPGVMSQLHGGQQITVNGDEGRVYLKGVKRG